MGVVAPLDPLVPRKRPGDAHPRKWVVAQLCRVGPRLPPKWVVPLVGLKGPQAVHPRPRLKGAGP